MGIVCSTLGTSNSSNVSGTQDRAARSWVTQASVVFMHVVIVHLTHKPICAVDLVKSMCTEHLRSAESCRLRLTLCSSPRIPGMLVACDGRGFTFCSITKVMVTHNQEFCTGQPHVTYCVVLDGDKILYRGVSARDRILSCVLHVQIRCFRMQLTGSGSGIWHDAYLDMLFDQPLLEQVPAFCRYNRLFWHSCRDCKPLHRA